MSWLFGIFRKNNSPFPKFEVDEEFQKVEIDNLFLAISNGLNSSLEQSNNILQAFVGIPIQNFEGKRKILQKLNSSNINPDELFGHFVYINYSNNKFLLSNDAFGLREIYFIETEQNLFFSTRQDLLSEYLNNVTINPTKFSSLWLTNFQLSNDSIINEIKKLGPNGKIVSDGNKITVTNKKFNGSNNYSQNEDLVGLVSKYCSSETSGQNEISLALSGGIDSRYVLSLLEDKDKFSCHTIINEEDKDLKISKEICSKLNLQHELIRRKDLNLGEIENELLYYYKFISPNIPLSQLLDFGFYGIGYLKDKLILDGGFGGFYRRQYLNKIFFIGAKLLNINSESEIKSLLYAPKPSIFNGIFHENLEAKLGTEINNLLPEAGESDCKDKLAEILDIISVRFMLSNIYGSGQTILDQEITSIMPLAQKDVIYAGMDISLKEKINSKLFKKTIKKNNSTLAKINLVNNNLENPYYLNYKLAMVKLLINRKFFRTPNYERYSNIISSEEYVKDVVSSNFVKTNKYLDYEQNVKITKQFFNGDQTKSAYMDWLLTFILWSKANNIS